MRSAMMFSMGQHYTTINEELLIKILFARIKNVLYVKKVFSGSFATVGKWMFARYFLPAFLDEFLHISNINQSCNWHQPD